MTIKRLVVAVVVAPIVVFVAWELYDSKIAHPPADMTKLEPAFITAAAEIKDQAAKAVAAGKAKDYAAAVRSLGVIGGQRWLLRGAEAGPDLHPHRDPEEGV